MKWFFALNEASGNFAHFADMAKVAVHSAQQYTNLEPYFIYDGQENELTQWMRERGVQIIFRRSWLYPALSCLADAKQRENIRIIGAGTFMRLEIPAIAQEMGFGDEVVLYTDCDVMFLSDVVPTLSAIKPNLFSFAPEEDPNNHLEVNCGVMLMNLPNLIAREKDFRSFVSRYLGQCCDWAWDQTAYTWFYHPLMRKLLALGVRDHRAVRICRGLYKRGIGPKPLWNPLSIEYNWKPYWENSERAKIVHFHGPKPYERDILTSKNPPAHLRHLLPMMRGSYSELSDVWVRTLEQATQ